MTTNYELHVQELSTYMKRDLHNIAKSSSKQRNAHYEIFISTHFNSKL